MAPGLDAFLALLRGRIDDGTVWNPTMAVMSAWMDRLAQVAVVQDGGATTLTNKGAEPIDGVTIRALHGSCVTAGDPVSSRDDGGEHWFVFTLAPGASVTIAAPRSP